VVGVGLWGPYLWADGTSRRKSDGFKYGRGGFRDTDGTHPSDSGGARSPDLVD